MLAGDVTDILITNQLVGERKMRRLARLARAYAPARLGVCVDNLDVARQLSTICEAEEARVEVYVDVDLGRTAPACKPRRRRSSWRGSWSRAPRSSSWECTRFPA